MANPLKSDPTRTTTLRRRFLGGMRKRFRALKGAINKLIVKDDVFGLDAKGPLTFNVEPKAWAFATDEQKVKNFDNWLQQEIDSGILETDANDDPWTAKYIQQAYDKGAKRAVTDTNKVKPILSGLQNELPVLDGVVTTFLKAPEQISKVKLLSTRAFGELRGIGAATAQKLNRILSNGIIAGLGPRELASQINSEIDSITKKRALVMARTEIIHAHAEGQLDSFEDLGIDELGVMAEWATADDAHVCELCRPLDGVVMTVKQARGMIPRHPNCRCAFIPAIGVEDNKTTRKNLRKAIKKSVKAGGDSDRWVGKGKAI